MADSKIQVFSIVRIDDSPKSEVNPEDFQQLVTVKQIVPTQAEAEQEVYRLNELNAEKGARYFWQATRYFPNGR